MPLLFSIQVFTGEVIHALSWTLVHSLWQGMLLAVVAGSIILSTKRSASLTRYNLLTISLFVFIAGIAATFYIQLTDAITVSATKNDLAAATLITSQENNNTFLSEPRPSIAREAANIINSNSHWIIMAWLLVIALRCIQLTVGLYHVYKLKKRQVFSAGDYWNNRIIELSRQLGVKKNVRLLQSCIARVPAVAGFFKPIILFPAGMLASLSPDEVEAILVHELAHIRRKDFLVNVLQYVVEILFFFNPGVRWVSSLIRTERENCCDDIAIRQTGNRRNYINSLIAFQEYDPVLTPAFTNAFAGQKEHLLNRVKRIIYNNNKTLNNMEKKFLAAGMLVTCVFIFAFSPDQITQKAVKANIAFKAADISLNKQIMPSAPLITDTVPDKVSKSKVMSNGTINSVENGKSYRILTKDGEIAELYVDDKKIPADKINAYKNVTDKIVLKSQKDMEQSRKDMMQSQKDMEQSRLDMLQSQRDMEQSRKDMEQSLKDMEQSKLDMAQSQKEVTESQKEMEDSKQEMDKELKINLEEAKKEMEEARLEMEQAKVEIARAKVEMEQAKKDMAHDMEASKKDMEQARKDIAQSKIDIAQSKKDIAASQQLQGNLIADFIREKLIKEKNDLSSFTLSNDELIINGVKQPAAMHQKFREKYVKSKNWTMTYNND